MNAVIVGFFCFLLGWIFGRYMDELKSFFNAVKKKEKESKKIK